LDRDLYGKVLLVQRTQPEVLVQQQVLHALTQKAWGKEVKCQMSICQRSVRSPGLEVVYVMISIGDIKSVTLLFQTRTCSGPGRVYRAHPNPRRPLLCLVFIRIPISRYKIINYSSWGPHETWYST
jgi:hypothetical protein